MRFLPYVLVLFMAAPIFAWFLIDTLMVKGTATVFSGNDLYVVITLGAFVLVAFGLLATWMDKFISKTR